MDNSTQADDQDTARRARKPWTTPKRERLDADSAQLSSFVSTDLGTDES